MSLAVEAAGDMLTLELRPAVPLRVLVGARRLDLSRSDLPACVDPDGPALVGAGGNPAVDGSTAEGHPGCLANFWVEPGMRFELVGVPPGTDVEVHATVGAHGDFCEVPIEGGLGVHLTRGEGDAP